MAHQITVPYATTRRLLDEARVIDTRRARSWAECRSPYRGGESWTTFPAWHLPWNRPRQRRYIQQNPETK